MRQTSVEELVQKCPGQWLYSAVGISTVLDGIGTDTRKDLTGQVFWALKGESFDAHDFLDKAVQQGARALVVDRAPTDEQLKTWNVHVVLVPNSLQGLQAFAREIRRGLKAKVVGITGSNGKTSTKEFLATILKPEMRVHWNPGSFNNHFGLPFNLLQTPPDADVVIAEMGMNHAGELTELCRIAEPDLVVCTMVGSAHIEHFGSIDKIAAAKEEIYQAAPMAATRVFNADNSWTQKMSERARFNFPVARVLQFSNLEKSLGQRAFDVVLVKSESTSGSASWGLSLKGRIGDRDDRVETALLGDHNMVNLAAAASCALALGVPPAHIWKNISLCKAHWGRMQPLKAESGTAILFDGYNANPESMQAMLGSLQSTALRQIRGSGKVYAVLAEMRELGESAEQAHFNLGKWAAESSLSAAYFYGPSASSFAAGWSAASSAGTLKKAKNPMVSDTYEESLALQLASMLNPSDLVVVKGSRGMKTERFVELLKPLGFQAKA